MTTIFARALSRTSAFVVVALSLLLGASAINTASGQPRKRAQIGKRINELIGTEMKAWCNAKGVAYPPDKVLFRVFKKEQEIEVWAMNEGMDSMENVRSVPICSMDFNPGPKLEEDDDKTPEGFYLISRESFGTGSEYYWMWMKLDEANIDDDGIPDEGSCVKICLDYPNDVDTARSKVGLGIKKPGYGICIHGNCITAGCVSFNNRNMPFKAVLSTLKSYSMEC